MTELTVTGTDNTQRSRIRETLEQHLGMSDYEARVYLTLVENGKQSMNQIAQESDVPKQRVYDITEKLEVKGFVEIVDEYPKQAYAVDPSETFEMVKQRVERAEERVQQLYSTVDAIDSGIATFKSISSIEKYVRRNITSATTSLTVVLPEEFLPQFEDSLTARNNSTYTRLLIAGLPTERVGEETIHIQGVGELADEVRGFSSDEALTVTADRQRSFFWAGGSHLETTAESYGVQIMNSELVFLFDRFVSHSLWPRSKPLHEREQVPDLPADYIRIRNCLEDLIELAGDNPVEDFEVSFEGFDTDTREWVRLSGTVVGYDYDPDYIVASLEIQPQGRDETVSLGGWKASVEDYEARQITLSRRD